MTCGAMMTENPASIRADETVGEAARRLVDERQMVLPVVDESGRFHGMFGIADIFSLVIPKVALAGGLLPNLRFMGDDVEELRKRFRDAADRKVGDVADRRAPFVHPDTTQIEALRLFGQQHSTLAVVERETRKLLGIISHSDAICALTGAGKNCGPT